MAPLNHALDLRPQGIALEFGVATGESLAVIAKRMPVIGFDSFRGLPERWRDGFEAGMFTCAPPEVPGACLVLGAFEESLPAFVAMWGHLRVGLLHIDCDLYSSTVTVLDHVMPMLRDDALVLFDEYHGYEGWEDHEARAWSEYTERTGQQWDLVTKGQEQALFRLRSSSRSATGATTDGSATSLVS